MSTTIATRETIQPNQPEADSGHDYPMAKPNAHTEEDFRVAVMGPATLSLKASEIAISKADNAKAVEFANFELREAIGVVQVLTEAGTPAAELDAASLDFLEQLETLPQGAEFDKLYIGAELANHLFLRDLAISYLANSAGQQSAGEIQVRHLATVALAFFKEHVVLCKNITREL